MKSIHLHIGNHGEALIADYLTKKGYAILMRNYRTQGGEIDIIARSKEYIMFVEVKMRTKHFFDLSTSITPSKQRKIIQTAEYFLMQHALYENACRFDVALLEPDVEGKLAITYLENAYQKEDW